MSWVWSSAARVSRRSRASLGAGAKRLPPQTAPLARSALTAWSSSVAVAPKGSPGNSALGAQAATIDSVSKRSRRRLTVRGYRPPRRGGYARLHAPGDHPHRIETGMANEPRMRPTEDDPHEVDAAVEHPTR